MTRYGVKLRVFHDMDTVVGFIRRSMSSQVMKQVDSASSRVEPIRRIKFHVRDSVPFNPDDLIRIKEII